MNTKTYTKKQFLEDVAKEARALKKNATKEEINNLDLFSLNARSTYDCVYGQMTGHCRSKRAVKLITKCCKRFSHLRVLDEIGCEEDGRKVFASIRRMVNGTKSENPESISFISSVETYIGLPNARHKNLIAFLKGERKDLVL